MKRYGDSRLKTAVVVSDQFESTTPFNRLTVNSLSEVDQETLDHDVIILNKEDDCLYSYNAGHDSWINMNTLDIDALPRVYFNTAQDIYNAIWIDESTSNYLSIAPDMLDLGDIGDPQNFVIDFWIINDPFAPVAIGPIIYNGLQTGPVDLEVNKNMLITTSGAVLVKDPNNQSATPSTVQNIGDDGYINVFRPRLKSLSKINTTYKKHVAIIRSGETTYLAIDGVIEASATSVEYFHYDPVKIGAGYVGAFNGGIINLRVSKGTDLGWTTNFDPPNYNPQIDQYTHFLMGSNTCIDTTTNHVITIVGTTPFITQNRFHYQLTDAHQNSIIMSNLSQTNIVFRLPRNCQNKFFHFDARSSNFEVISFDSATCQNKVFCKTQFNKFATFTIRNGIFVKSMTKQQYDIDYVYDKFNSLTHTSYITAFSDFIYHYDSGIGFSNGTITPNVVHTLNKLPFTDSVGIIDCSLGPYSLKNFSGNNPSSGAFQLSFLFYLSGGVASDYPIISGMSGATLNQLILKANETLTFQYMDAGGATRTVNKPVNLLAGRWYNIIIRFLYINATTSPLDLTYALYDVPNPDYGTTATVVGHYMANDILRVLNQGPWYIANLKYRYGTDRAISYYTPRVYSELAYLTLC